MSGINVSFIVCCLLATGLSIQIIDNVPIITQHTTQVNRENILLENDHQLALYFGNQITQVATHDQINSMVKEIIDLTDISAGPVTSLKYKFEIGYGTSGLKILHIHVKLQNRQYDIKTTYLDVSVNVPQQYNIESVCTRKYVKVMGIKLWRESDCRNVNVMRGLNDEEIKEIKTHLENKLYEYVHLFKEEQSSPVFIEVS